MKMLKIKRLFPLYALVVSLAVVACGGGGGSDSVAGGGIGGTGITASGAITGFGSIKLNGLVLDTTNATRLVDGVPAADDSALAIGMVVTVKGTLSADGVNGTADEITYDDDVQGPIQEPIVEIDQTKAFSVMGIQVSVSRISTVFENTDYDSLRVGGLVELSGFFDGSGILHATRLEDKTGNEIEVKGTVNSFGPIGGTFTLDVTNGAIQYTVDFSSTDLPPLLVANEFVEVKGTLAADPGDFIVATEVARAEEGFDDVDKASIEGIVTEFNTLADFKVAGQRVDAAGVNVSYIPSGLATSLADGMQVEVEGPIASGVLQAVRVEARGGDVEVGAMVVGVDPDTGSILLGLAPGNLAVLVDSQTLLRDDTEMVDRLTLEDIVAMDYLEVEAYLDNSGGLVATEVRRDDLSDDLLQGPVDSCNGVTVTILGLGYVLDDDITSYVDEDENPNSIISAIDFCAQANAGALAKVVDKQSDTGPDGVADEAELEN